MAVRAEFEFNVNRRHPNTLSVIADMKQSLHKLQSRFNRLTLWNKLAAIGSVASIIALAWVIVALMGTFFSAPTVEGFAYSHGFTWGPRTASLHSDVLHVANPAPHNASVVRIVVWNCGSSPIESDAVSDDLPITIHAPNGMRFTEASELSRSRDELEFSIVSNDDRIEISMTSDSAFESGDGIAVLLTLESDSDIPLSQHYGMVADIKGVSNEVHEVHYTAVASLSGAIGRASLGYTMSLTLAFIGFVIGGWCLQRVRGSLKGDTTKLRGWGTALAAAIPLLVVVYFSLGFFFHGQLYRAIHYPSWYLDTEFSQSYDPGMNRLYKNVRRLW